jgi:hypothetical protein
LAVLCALILAAADARAGSGGDTGEFSPNLIDRIHISGTVEGDIAWSRRGGVGGGGADAASEISISTVEFGVRADIAEWMFGDVVFVAEDLGTAEETGVSVDQATLTLEAEGAPVYAVFGKRVQPFGVFENHLVADPMTQDAYETNRPGLTVGFAWPWGLDISATAYGGEEMIGHLFESGLFDSSSVSRAAHPEADDISSLIVSASLEPAGGFLVFGSFVSEPGAGRRNDTVSAGFSLALDGEAGLRVDGEYMKALRREVYEGFDRDFKEGVLSVTVAYEFVMREREVIGGALFAERKAHRVSEPLEVALRYEHFDDGGLAEASGAWTVEERYGGGARYAFYNDPEKGLAAYVAFEYRRSEFRNAPGNDEVFTRLGFTF